MDLYIQVCGGNGLCVDGPITIVVHTHTLFFTCLALLSYKRRDWFPVFGLC